MEEVLALRHGRWRARARILSRPPRRKTGTSHDGWFAGFTSRLICVVWVGFDDNRDIKLEGARSALPIWTEFMKRAHQHPEYRSVATNSPAPNDVVTVQIDAETGELATPDCPEGAQRKYLSTEPSLSKPAICTPARDFKNVTAALGLTSHNEPRRAGNAPSPLPVDDLHSFPRRYVPSSCVGGRCACNLGEDPSPIPSFRNDPGAGIRFWQPTTRSSITPIAGIPRCGPARTLPLRHSATT